MIFSTHVASLNSDQDEENKDKCPKGLTYSIQHQRAKWHIFIVENWDDSEGQICWVHSIIPMEEPIRAPITCDKIYIFTLRPFFSLMKAKVTDGLR